ncbi:hypothetical protein [Haliangium sp. UPWRP_2]|nr:hypothetical protein [Haliangium sp. UPWRP_2]
MRNAERSGWTADVNQTARPVVIRRWGNRFRGPKSLLWNTV